MDLNSFLIIVIIGLVTGVLGGYRSVSRNGSFLVGFLISIFSYTIFSVIINVFFIHSLINLCYN